ncbi:MAG: hypothetical protein V4552_02665 [Pseudomonadota bacterium]
MGRKRRKTIMSKINKPRLDKTRRQMNTRIANYIAYDQRLKIQYFIPHGIQNLADASPFGLYTPGLHDSARSILFAATLQADIRELVSNPTDILHMRLRRVISQTIVPVQIDSLVQVVKSLSNSFFKVFITNNNEMAEAVDKLMPPDRIPFLHISTLEGTNRISIEEFKKENLFHFIIEVLEFVEKSEIIVPDIEQIKLAINSNQAFIPSESELPMSFHNLTLPNESALKVFGKELNNEDPISPQPYSEFKRDEQTYIDRICLAADTVMSERSALMQHIPSGLMDNLLLISVPSLPWQHYQKNNIARKLKGIDLKAFDTVYKRTIKQSTYFDNVETTQEIFENNYFQWMMRTRAMDALCYTAGLTVIATSTMVPVIRLEPKLNQVRGDVKLLAHCVRSESRIRAQHKQSRLARKMAFQIRNLTDNKFLKRIDMLSDTNKIQGLKVVSDLPLEWMSSNGLPLGIKFDLTRIPLMPGNIFLMRCLVKPTFVSLNSLFDILVIRSFAIDDPLSDMLQKAINSSLNKIKKPKVKVKFIDVKTVNDLIVSLSTFDGAILIFDGHGAYDSNNGIGAFVIGGNTIDAWELQKQCNFPPIVIFSACDTHPIDGSHGSIANAAFMLGARSVLATTLPVNGGLAAILIGRLIFRISEYVPLAIDHRALLTWRDVVSGMLRMEYVTEILLVLRRYTDLEISKVSVDHIQLQTNIAINQNDSSWYDLFLSLLSKESLISKHDLQAMIDEWASLTDVIKYIQLGSPENIILYKD